MYAGVNDGVRKNAESSAAVFTAAYAQMERRAAALAAAIDPAVAAQQRFDREMGEARNLISSGAISLDQYVAKLRIEQGALDNATRAQGRAATSANAHRVAMQGLSFQAQDAFTQISMGTNPLSVLAIQGGQAAGQMANLGGKVGAVANFMIGPWGLAITGGLLLLGALTDRLMKAGGAADAKKGSIKSLTDSINDLNEATGRQIKSEQAVQAETLRSAGALRQKALDARTATIETLKAARASLAEQDAKIDPSSPDGGLNFSVAVGGTIERRISRLDALLKAQQADVAKSEVTFRQAQVPIMQGRVAETFDQTAAATGRFNRAVDALNQRYARGKVDQASYTAELTKLTTVRERETEAARKGRSASTELADADARAASASTDVQRAQAKLSQVRAQARAELKAGSITQAEYTSRVAEAERGVNSAREATREHTKATRDAAAAQRELSSDLAEIVRRFDPVRAAAEQYAETLGKIATLRGAGKLGRADAQDFTTQAIVEENQRRVEAAAEAGRKILGIDGDPLAETINRYGQEQAERVAMIGERMQADRQRQEDGIQRLAGMYQTLFSGGTKSLWREFQDLGRQVLSELLAKWTLGSARGGGGLLSSLTSLFGASKGLSGGIGSSGDLVSIGSVAAMGGSGLPKLASGTEYWSGGMALLGEGGQEAAWLPRGTRVSSAGETRRMMAGNDNRPASITKNYFTGNLLTPDFWAQIEAGDAGAAVRGAAGGAAISQAERQASGMRRLGRF
jgi:hypothetical protein